MESGWITKDFLTLDSKLQREKEKVETLEKESQKLEDQRQKKDEEISFITQAWNELAEEFAELQNQLDHLSSTPRRTPKMLLLLGGAVICLVFVGLIFIFATSEKYAKIVRFKEEKFYLNPQTKEKQLFPSVEEKATLLLSVIVPAYNEEKRLPVMLEECLDYLEKKLKSNPKNTYEVLIVDDGSTDKTTEVGLGYSEKYGCDKVRVLTLIKNRGKGGAVRLGMLSARGQQLLFADADGATTFEDISKLQKNLDDLVKGESLESALGLVCGSRAHLEKEAIASRSIARTFLMKGFHLLVWLFAARSIRDTQCGFKLLTRATARLCFPNLHIERWAFDVELIYIAEHVKIPTGEISVRWTEIEGSKIVPVWSWLQMGRDLFLIWLRYSTGAWGLRLDSKEK
uniref:Dolichyl-phosphate beta-glucosyltransferase n=1 Tax=Simocephalus serrulatus TaxID=117539 RepID=A0A4Y7NML3_9CRUS|nr:EOG090X0BIY [Simocephalus serrulatus]SVE94442.1 EOG090X0BIY [Simocephalus serrulatus]